MNKGVKEKLQHSIKGWGVLNRQLWGGGKCVGNELARKGWLTKFFMKFLWCPLEAGKGLNLSPANDWCVQSTGEEDTLILDAALFGKDGEDRDCLISH